MDVFSAANDAVLFGSNWTSGLIKLPSIEQIDFHPLMPASSLDL